MSDKKEMLTMEQQLVIDTNGKSLLVSASAGSGKTFVVVRRIMTKIINELIDIDKILVVTFTNAAAVELKDRIIKEIYEKLREDNKADASLRKHLQRQLLLINRSNISTIHSFCLNIIKSNFYELGVEPNIKTIDENKGKMKLLEIINTLLDKEYEGNTEEFLKLLDIFRTDENLIDAMEKIYNFSRNMINPNEWLDKCLKQYQYSASDGSICDLTELNYGRDILSDVKEELQKIKIELEIIISKISKYEEFRSRQEVLESICEMVTEIQVMDKYNDMFNALNNIKSLPSFSRANINNEDLKKEVSDIKEKTSKKLKEIKKIIYKDTEGILRDLNSMQNVVDWIVRFIKRIDIEYSNIKKANGWIDFSDYEHLALKALSNEETREQYINSFKEVYIDEYQDTSELQEQILSLISKDDNKIMVGDIKQSIYSFRNADPSIFNAKYTKFKNILNMTNNAIDNGNENKEGKIILSKNFRSRKDVIDSINSVFSKTMSSSVGECEYSDNEYLVYADEYPENDSKDYVTEINIIGIENNAYNTSSLHEELLEEKTDEYIDELSKTEIEAHYVADRIKKLIDSDFKVYDVKKKEYRKCEYKDIVILMRSISGKGEVFEKVLKEQFIPAFTDSSNSFYNGSEVGLILSFLKVLDNYYDDIAIVSIMYSIIGKFTLDEITSIRKENKNEYMYKCLLKYREYSDEALSNKVKDFLEIIQKFSIYINTYSISEVLQKIYTETGIYYSIYLEEMGQQKCSNLDSLVEITRNFENEEKVSLYEYIKYIENMKEKKAKSADTPKLIGEGENVVRILTIHKSKGLEFPIVILSCTSKQYNIMDVSNNILLDKDRGLGIDIYDYNLNIAYPSIIKQAIKTNIKDRITSEEMRLLYVAMTRAKEKLIIFGTVKNSDEFYSKNSYNGLEKISPVILKSLNNHLAIIIAGLSGDEGEKFNINNISCNKKNFYVSDAENNDDTIKNRSISKKELLLGKCSDIHISGNIKSIPHVFEQQYNFKNSSRLKSKYSVTEIKEITKDKTNHTKIKNIILNEEKPVCLDKTMEATKYGTILHRIMEMIDFKKYYLNNDKEYIMDAIQKENLLNGNNLNVEEVYDKIIRFLDSDIKPYVISALSIKKEVPFILFDDLKFINALEIPEKTYIQGVIDLLIKTNNNKYIVVDFKTDKIDSEKELVERYKTQLDIYASAIMNISNTAVDKKYIYSFYLNELIEVK